MQKSAVDITNILFLSYNLFRQLRKCIHTLLFCTYGQSRGAAAGNSRKLAWQLFFQHQLSSDANPKGSSSGGKLVIHVRVARSQTGASKLQLTEHIEPAGVFQPASQEKLEKGKSSGFATYKVDSGNLEME